MKYPLGLLLDSTTLTTDGFVAVAEQADELGFRELWYTDQKFHRDCFAELAVAARSTKKIMLGPGVSDPYSRHPAMLAMAIASIDEISQGRAVLGLGSGGQGLASMGMQRVRPLTGLTDAMMIVRAALGGQGSDYVGSVFRFSAATLGFVPPRSSIPIFIATQGRKTLTLCGRMADGVLLANVTSHDSIARATKIIRHGELEAGRPSGAVEVHLRLEVALCDDETLAVETMRKQVTRRLLNRYPSWQFVEDAGINVTSEMRELADQHDAQSLMKCIGDDDVRRMCLAGSTSQVADAVSVIMASGIDRLTIKPMIVEGQATTDLVASFAKLTNQLEAPANGGLGSREGKL